MLFVNTTARSRGINSLAGAQLISQVRSVRDETLLVINIPEPPTTGFYCFSLAVQIDKSPRIKGATS